ncbi:MAG TPA: glycosyltransferase family 4 protein [bacterium]|nr:glycosyltransferase family 4 protein [bacterium]
MKRRILFWNEYYLPTIGGIEVLCGHLSRALQSRGYEIAVLSDDREGRREVEETIDGTRVHRLPFRRGMAGDLASIVRAKKRLALIVAEFKPDLVHLHTSGPSLFYFLEERLFREIPSLWTIHSVDYPKVEWNRRVLGSVSAASAVSNYMRDQALSWSPESSPAIELVYNGLPMPELDTSPGDSVRPFVLIVGRAEPEKGFDIGLRAFAALKDAQPGLRLKIAGDGKELLALKELALELGIESKVDFLGWVEPNQAPSLMASASLALVPSRWEEPFGLVALEAAQRGKPVVASRVGGLPEIVVEGETGFLVAREDVGGMAGAMAKILGDSTLAQEMGRQARERARWVFGFERMVDEYEALYSSLSLKIFQPSSQ